MNLPKTADIVIIGGGVMGASVAYHLAARGQRNVLLLEKDAFFGQGATGRCAGGVRYQFSTEVNVQASPWPACRCWNDLRPRSVRRLTFAIAGI